MVVQHFLFYFREMVMEILAWIEGDYPGKDLASMLKLSMAHFDTILANNVMARLDGLH